MKRLALAVVLLLAVVVGMRVTSGWTLACLLVDRGGVVWVILGCDVGEPDPPPGSNEG